VSTADTATSSLNAPVSETEAGVLFAGLDEARGLVLAISGGPDSTALLWLVARWRRAQVRGPVILAVTVDHALRPEARAEAAAVKRLAKRCGIAHRTMRWSDAKPKTGLQQAARHARYRLLVEAAARIGADHILTAHTADDQAETVLIRLSRGSGITGLAGMARAAAVPDGVVRDVVLLRPLLDLSKARLIATVEAAGLDYADDPSNRDPRFTRARVRALMPALAREGLDTPRLSQFARRLRRAEAALAVAAEGAWQSHAQVHAGDVPVIALDRLFALPAEIQVRLLGRAVAQVGTEGPVELAKLEALHAALMLAENQKSSLRRTLAGAMVTFRHDRLTVEPAPARRAAAGRLRAALNQGATLAPQSGQTALE
jgi:tRNA(Ile)-lysidine synthase